MNINQVSKLFSDMNSQEVKTLELKVGQVVRGVVTQQLPNQEALVNINGVQIKAKLEVPIMEGQGTLMQVAPDSKGSFIHLRQVDPSSVGLQDPMKDILKAMNLPDKEWSNQLIRELRQEGFPLNKETIQALAQGSRLVPANVDLESWIQAATQVFKRGMPMTLASISAMHQLSQGQPLHHLVSQLQQQLAQVMQTQGQQLSAQTAQLLQQLTTGLNQMLQIQGEGQVNQSQTTRQGQQALSGSLINSTQINQQTGALQGQINQVGSAQTIQTDATQSMATHTTQNGGTQAAAITQNPIVSFMKILGVQYENQLSQQVLQRGEVAVNQPQQNQLTKPNATSQAQTNNSTQTQTVGALVNHIQTAQSGQQQAMQVNLAAVNQQLQGQQVSQVIPQNNQTASQLIQSNLINQEQQQVQHTLLSQQQSTTPQQQSIQQHTIGQQLNQNIAQQLDANGVNVQVNQAVMTNASDSIKATVMQALQMSDIPIAVKESLSQLLNHITGQQMMLSPERNTSLFTHITMFIPIKDDNGGQTAAIHVQTRRDRKGQLDAENCRIVFDLQMNQIGQTLVDMNVVNKIVSINIWNDASYIQSLIDSMRPEIISSIQKTGYSLSSIKATPFKQEEQPEHTEVKAIVQPPDLQHMKMARYKGVDFKV